MAACNDTCGQVHHQHTMTPVARCTVCTQWHLWPGAPSARNDTCGQAHPQHAMTPVAMCTVSTQWHLQPCALSTPDPIFVPCYSSLLFLRLFVPHECYLIFLILSDYEYLVGRPVSKSHIPSRTWAKPEWVPLSLRIRVATHGYDGFFPQQTRLTTWVCVHGLLYNDWWRGRHSC